MVCIIFEMPHLLYDLRHNKTDLKVFVVVIPKEGMTMPKTLRSVLSQRASYDIHELNNFGVYSDTLYFFRFLLSYPQKKISMPTHVWPRSPPGRKLWPVPKRATVLLGLPKFGCQNLHAAWCRQALSTVYHVYSILQHSRNVECSLLVFDCLIKLISVW